MSVNILQYCNSGVGVTGLGESNPDILESLKSPNFNNYSYAITVTLKGSHKLRSMEDDLQKQYDFFKNIISTIVDEHSTEYYFAYELHKCGSWIHTHGIFNPKKKKSIQTIKQQIYLAIEGNKIKKGMSYRTRICIEKVFLLETWIPYITKERSLMESRYPALKNTYKLQKLPRSSNVVSFDL